MIGYIVPVSSTLFVGIVINKTDKNMISIYSNTSPRPNNEVLNGLNSIDDLTLEKNVPKEIQDLATKISLIKQGFDQDLSHITLDYSGYTEKQIQVIKTAMNIPVNEIWPYSRVAEAAGLPKAQRFVGTTMRVLRQPYIVPVHRVKSLSYIRKKERTGRRNFNKMPI